MISNVYSIIFIRQKSEENNLTLKALQQIINVISFLIFGGKSFLVGRVQVDNLHEMLSIN